MTEDPEDPLELDTGMLQIESAMAEGLRGQFAILIVAVPVGPSGVGPSNSKALTVSFTHLTHYADPRAWGVLLGDLLQHIASGYTSEGMDQVAIRQQILDAFMQEVEHPTDSPWLLHTGSESEN
jgi:hypothetical protein